MDNQQLLEVERIITLNHRSIAGIIVLKEGKQQYENYFNNCSASSPVHLFSVTKSIVSILIGIAIDKGFIASVDQKILDFFPEYAINDNEKNIQTVTLRNVLTMTAPYKKATAPYSEFFSCNDWVKASLDALDGKKSAGEFQYMSLVGPDILSGILIRATGRPLHSFARDNLFTPMGITIGDSVMLQSSEDQLAFLTTRNISGWAADSQGVNTAGWGLTLTTTDMAKIGQLYLNGGKWEGRQIISSKWIQESTKGHIQWAETGLSFGYLWWPEIGNGYAAIGDSGNIIYVNPANSLVVSITSLCKSTANRIKLILEHIEPIFAG